VFRLFLAAALAAAFLPRPAAAEPPGSIPRGSSVYFAHDPQAISQFDENAQVTRRMVDRLVMAVTAQTSVLRAWRSLVSANDRVGIKVSTAGGRYFSSHRGVVEAVVAGLQAAGVPAAQLVVWDRDPQNLKSAGFLEKHADYTVRSIDPPRGYDRDAKIAAPVLGRLIWGDVLFQEKTAHPLGQPRNEADQLSSTSHLATVLSRDVTKVINVPLLADEAGCGVAGAIYNMTVSNMDNWRRFTQPEGVQSAALAAAYADERIAPKVVLHIMDGLIAQYAHGPAGNPNYAFGNATLYASKDPVALDVVALRLIEGWRKEAKLPPVGARAEWLQGAEELGLGNFSAERITLVPVIASHETN
jgi:hypothetical protein